MVRDGWSDALDRGHLREESLQIKGNRGARLVRYLSVPRSNLGRAKAEGGEP